MSNSVTVICPNRKHAMIKCTANMTVGQILREACMKHGYDSSHYALKFHSKRLDDSLPFRLAGLPNNCTVEVIRHEKETGVGVQKLSDGRRLTGQFDNRCSLLELLETLSLNDPLLLSDSSGAVPCIQYLTSDVAGLYALSHTTLVDLGINAASRVLLRFSHRPVTEERLSAEKAAIDARLAKQAMLHEDFTAKHEEVLRNEELESQAELQSFTGDQFATPATDSAHNTERLNDLENSLRQLNENIQNGAVELPAQLSRFLPEPVLVEPAPVIVNFKFPEDTRGLDLMAQHSSSVTDAPRIQACERRAVLFHQDETAEAASASDDVPADFFELTASDAQLMQLRLREASYALNTVNPDVTFWPIMMAVIRKGLFISCCDMSCPARTVFDNRALVSDAVLRTENLRRKRMAYKFTVIRVLFPEQRQILQGVFRSEEPVHRVYDFVREYLDIRSGGDFDLYLPPSILLHRSSQQDFVEVGLAPASTVIFRKPLNVQGFDVRFCESPALASSYSVAAAHAQHALGQNGTFSSYAPTVQDSSDVTTVHESKRPSEHDGPEESKLKFLAFGKGKRR